MAGKGCFVACMGVLPFIVMLCSVVLAVVGYLGTWGSADMQIAGGERGRADYTLWTVTPRNEQGPDSTYVIDETLCNMNSQGGDVGEVCNHFAGMRFYTVLALVASVLALAFSIIACVAARSARSCRMVRGVVSVLTAALSLVAACASVAALVWAWSMPDGSNSFDQRRTLGLGSTAMLLLVILGLAGTLLELCLCCTACCCRGNREDEDKKRIKAQEVVEHHHHHHHDNKEPVSESTDCSTPRRGSENV